MSRIEGLWLQSIMRFQMLLSETMQNFHTQQAKCCIQELEHMAPTT